MNVGKIFSEFSINFFKIKTATGHFANQPALVLLSRFFEFRVSKFLFPFSMSNQGDSFFTFKSRDFIINRNVAETGRSNMFSPKMLKFACDLRRNLNSRGLR